MAIASSNISKVLETKHGRITFEFVPYGSFFRTEILLIPIPIYAHTKNADKVLKQSVISHLKELIKYIKEHP